MSDVHPDRRRELVENYESYAAAHGIDVLAAAPTPTFDRLAGALADDLVTRGQVPTADAHDVAVGVLREVHDRSVARAAVEFHVLSEGALAASGVEWSHLRALAYLNQVPELAAQVPATMDRLAEAGCIEVIDGVPHRTGAGSLRYSDLLRSWQATPGVREFVGAVGNGATWDEAQRILEDVSVAAEIRRDVAEATALLEANLDAAAHPNIGGTYRHMSEGLQEASQLEADATAIRDHVVRREHANAAMNEALAEVAAGGSGPSWLPYAAAALDATPEQLRAAREALIEQRAARVTEPGIAGQGRREWIRHDVGLMYDAEVVEAIDALHAHPADELTRGWDTFLAGPTPTPAASDTPASAEPAGEPLEDVVVSLRASGYYTEDLQALFGGLDGANGTDYLGQLAELAASHPDPAVRAACDLSHAPDHAAPPAASPSWDELAAEATAEQLAVAREELVEDRMNKDSMADRDEVIAEVASAPDAEVVRWIDRHWGGWDEFATAADVTANLVAPEGVSPEADDLAAGVRTSPAATGGAPSGVRYDYIDYAENDGANGLTEAEIRELLHYCDLAPPGADAMPIDDLLDAVVNANDGDIDIVQVDYGDAEGAAPEASESVAGSVTPGDAPDEGPGYRVTISAGVGAGTDVTVPEGELVEWLIGEGLASPAARDMPMDDVIYQVVEANGGEVQLLPGFDAGAPVAPDGTPGWVTPGPVEVEPRPVTSSQTVDGFGAPLDEAGRRLFAYREAGYQGWLNEQGEPVAPDPDVEGGWRPVVATDAAGQPIVADLGDDGPETPPPAAGTAPTAGPGPVMSPSGAGAELAPAPAPDAREGPVGEATPRVWESHHRDTSTGRVTYLGSAQVTPWVGTDRHVEVTYYDEHGDRIPGGGFTEVTTEDAAARLERNGFRPYGDEPTATEAAAGTPSCTSEVDAPLTDAAGAAGGGRVATPFGWAMTEPPTAPAPAPAADVGAMVGPRAMSFPVPLAGAEAPAARPTSAVGPSAAGPMVPGVAL